MDEHFILMDWDQIRFIIQQFIFTDVALMLISTIGKNQNLNVLIDCVLQDTKDLRVLVFSYVSENKSEMTGFSIPKMAEVVAFIGRPLIQIIMVLDPVLPKLDAGNLSVPKKGKQ